MDELEMYLSGIDMKEYYEVFQRHALTLNDVMDLTCDELEKLGITNENDVKKVSELLLKVKKTPKTSKVVSKDGWAETASDTAQAVSKHLSVLTDLCSSALNEDQFMKLTLPAMSRSEVAYLKKEVCDILCLLDNSINTVF